MRSNNRFARAAVALALAGSLVVPYIAEAHGDDLAVARKVGLEVRADASASVAFCSRLAAHIEATDARVVLLGSQLAKVREDARLRLEKQRADREAKEDAFRTEADARFEARLTALDEQADTDAKKSALATFQTSVAAAVRAHRAAIDAANATFKKGLDAAITLRKSQEDAALAKLKASIRAALTKANSDCALGVSLSSIQSNLRTGIQAAVTTYRQDRQGMAKISATVNTLIEARRAAHAKAMIDFKAAIDKAKIDLKAAFSAEASADANDEQ